MSKTFEQGREEVAKLCEYFGKNQAAFRASGVKEAHVRQSLIDPFFEALGWDVRNAAMVAPQYREVVPEDSLDVEGRQRAPDYTFRVGPLPKFYAEAKKCGVNIGEDPASAFQLRRYGWSAKVAVSLLTSFEEFSEYDCTVRPRPSDKAATRCLRRIRFEEYPDRWRDLWDVFSREAVWDGRFDKYAADKRGKRGTSEVDEEFLKEIEGWRESLARNIALRNGDLSSDDLNAAVQLTIDRIVFLRMAEDRGLEPYEQLLRLCERPDIYERFMRDVCRKADAKYNSGLFHFQEEPGISETPDRITPKLAVDDRTFKPILQGLYFAHGSPYHFGVLPLEILGTVYERFLGKVIRLTAGHQAKIEEKPEVRKAGGVYYTPAYVVDYIVRHTVGRQIEGRSPAQLAGSRDKGQPFRVLDMACGSGSFLLGAYQCLLDHCLKWYIDHKPKSHQKAIYKDPRKGHWRLTIEEKKRILTSHVFGVDIDPQAVEVSKLSLLLKVLEGETDQTLQLGLLPFSDRALPNLADNIRCGNSLIGPDYFAARLPPDPVEIRRVKPFDWAQAFPDALSAGGFDCVIGNPPWGANLDAGELEYLRAKHSRVVARMIDSYIYFTDKAIRLAKENCPVGYIVPSTLLNQVDTRPLRDILLERGLTVLVNVGQGVFGKKVLNTSSIIVSRKRESSLTLGDLSSVAIDAKPGVLMSVGRRNYSRWQEIVRADPHRTFFTRDLDETALLDRLRRQCHSLASAIRGTIQRGVSPDIAAAHVLPNREAKRLRLEADLLRPSLSGGQIKRYRPWESDQVVIYTTRHTPIDKYPRCLAHLARFKADNTCKEVEQNKHPWWALHRPREPAIFSAPKLIGLTTHKSIELVFDESAGLFVTDAMYVFAPRPEIAPKALMAVMQSKLFRFLYRVANMGEARVIPQIKASKLLTLPIPDLSSDGRLLALSDRMLELNKHLAAGETVAEKDLVQRQIDETDAEIDRLVYDLYGLTADEINLVEGKGGGAKG